MKHELPATVENEEALLGAILSDSSVLTDVIDIVHTDDFYSASNATIYQSCLNLFDKGGIIDIVTVSDELTRMGKLAEVGDYPYLMTLSEGKFICANAVTYAKAVAEKSMKRSLIKVGDLIVKMGYDDTMVLDDTLTKAEEELFGVTQKSTGNSYSTAREVLPEVFDSIEKASKSSGITGIPTGFVDLDNRLKGLQNSNLILVGARPGMGKTAFMLEIARYAAVQKNVPVAIFNLEMSKKEMAMRILSSQSNVTNEKLKTGDLTQNDWADIAQASAEIARAPIYIDDVIDSNIQSIRAKCRKLKLEHDIALIVIDYIQLISSTGRGGDVNRQQEVADISRSLKMMARELNVPVIAGCQLNRLVDQRPDKHPNVSDLRESGGLEQDADVVLLLYREEQYNEETEHKNVAEVITGKFRNGQPGTDTLYFDKEHVTFKNMVKKS